MLSLMVLMLLSIVYQNFLRFSMTSGTFQVGETVTGRIIQTGLGEANTDVTPAITFRVAQSNHREGPYNAATKVLSR